jgi:mannose-1-phosphate guanylyltransferase
LIHEPVLLGTGGGIAQLAAALDRGPLLVLAGDIVADFDLVDLTRTHGATGAEATMGLTNAADPAVFGPVGVDDDGRLVDIVHTLGHRAAREMVNASVHLLEPEFVARLRPEPSCLVRQGYLPALAADAHVASWLHTGAWAETGTPAGLLAAQAAALRGELPVDPVLFARGGRRLGSAALVHPSAHLGAGCQLSEGTVVGPRARLAAGTRLERCFVEARASVSGAHRGALLLHDDTSFHQDSTSDMIDSRHAASVEAQT